MCFQCSPVLIFYFWLGVCFKPQNIRPLQSIQSKLLTVQNPLKHCLDYFVEVITAFGLLYLNFAEVKAVKPGSIKF